MSLYEEWLKAKSEEGKAQARRRELEDRLLKEVDWKEGTEGTKTFGDDDYSCKITGRLTTVVDSDKVQDLARENNVYEYLFKLFRWKAEINKRIWNSTDEKVTGCLMDAITTKAGRPSFKIERKEK